MPVFKGEELMTFSFGSSRRQKRRRVYKTYSIKSEEELARELASRGVSPFKDVRDSHRACMASLFVLSFSSLFLFCHIWFFFDIYAVQFSKITGNYAETEATVIHASSSRKVVRDCDSDTASHNCTRRISIVYSVNAVADDGTGFRFSGKINYGSEGARIRVKYSRSNPSFAYVDADLWDMLSDRSSGVPVLIIFVICIVGASRRIIIPMFKWILKSRTVAARGLYLPVLETGYEKKTARGPGGYNEFAPVYRYAMPDGTELLFRGRWTKKKPEGELANRYTKFRVYMMNPEDPDNNEYFIKKIPRHF